MTELPPFVTFYAAALLIVATRGRLRQVILLATPLLGALQLLGIEDGIRWQLLIMDLELVPYRVDRLSLLFGFLFHLAAFLGVIFSLHLRDVGQHVAGLTYVGSALGAVFAGDLVTLFVFWELLAITSVFFIWGRRSHNSERAGIRYLVIQVFSGVLLLAGAIMHFRATGALAFTYIGLNDLASTLIFVAFGIKAGFPLLHNWITDAYPEATPTGTVFLCMVTTKVAIYALARGFPGTEILVYIGAVMTCFPIFYAVIENDLRRVLAYSTINQLGFMVCGVGLGTALALDGAVAHAFNHVLFKGLLFMAMGAVLHMTGRINGSDLGGLYKSMPLTATFCIVGAASISAFPLFSGFISKALIMAAALEQSHAGVWLMLLFASAGVFHHAGIKIPFFAFFAHDAGIRTTEPPLNMLVAMGLAAFLCVLIGSYPWLLYAALPFPLDYQPFDSTHVIAQLQLLFFSAAAFTWLKLADIYPPELRSTNMDVDWLYRRLAARTIRRVGTQIRELDNAVRASTLKNWSRVVAALTRHHGPQGTLARTWPTGSMVLWVAVLLGASLVLYYL